MSELLGGPYSCVKLQFWLHVVKFCRAELFGDKKICDMVKEDRCVLCNEGEVKDIKHFIIECEELEQYRCELLGT